MRCAGAAVLEASEAAAGAAAELAPLSRSMAAKKRKAGSGGGGRAPGAAGGGQRRRRHAGGAAGGGGARDAGGAHAVRGRRRVAHARHALQRQLGPLGARPGPVAWYSLVVDCAVNAGHTRIICTSHVGALSGLQAVGALSGLQAVFARTALRRAACGAGGKLQLPSHARWMFSTAKISL